MKSSTSLRQHMIDVTADLGTEELAVSLVLLGKQVGLRKLMLDTFDRMSESELHLCRLAIDRLAMGQKQYGKLDLANDTRDFNRESVAEVIDRMHYGEMACLRRWIVDGMV